MYKDVIMLHIIIEQEGRNFKAACPQLPHEVVFADSMVLAGNSIRRIAKEEHGLSWENEHIECRVPIPRSSFYEFE